jgi:hypothetical protein
MLQADFLDVTTMRDQVGFSCAFLHPPGSAKKVSYENIALFFHINKGSVVPIGTATEPFVLLNNLAFFRTKPFLTSWRRRSFI